MTSIPKLIYDQFEVHLNPSGRFQEEGWQYQGQSHSMCNECPNYLEVFRKPTKEVDLNLSYWAIVCVGCRTCVDLSGIKPEKATALREWSSAHPLQLKKSRSNNQTRAIIQKDIKPTEEQIEIVNWFKKDKDIAVEALAGTGKTTTLRLLAEAAGTWRGVYLAFNKAIVEQARGLFADTPNISPTTAHALALGRVDHRYRQKLNRASRLTHLELAKWLQAPKFVFKTNELDHMFAEDSMARFASKSLRNFCKSTDEEISEKHIEIPHILLKHKETSSEFAQALLPYAKKIWSDISSYEGVLRFEHDHYMKLWQLKRPQLNFEYILFDEAQDADPVMLDIVNSQANSMLVYVGDRHQAIYEWRGARNAFNKVHVEKNLWLTQSFRFGPAIAEEANKVLKDLGAEKQVKGLDSIKSSVGPVAQPSVILCRTNAGAISALLNAQHKHLKVALIANTDQQLDFLKACQRLQGGQRVSHPDLASFENWNSFRSWVRSDSEEAGELKTYSELIDQYGTYKLISAVEKTVAESDADIAISTAHKAKGREWESVRLNGDFANLNLEDEEDQRLLYVAITRAQIRLDISGLSANLEANQKVETASQKPRTRNRPPISD